MPEARRPLSPKGGKTRGQREGSTRLGIKGLSLLLALILLTGLGLYAAAAVATGSRSFPILIAQDEGSGELSLSEYEDFREGSVRLLVPVPESLGCTAGISLPDSLDGGAGGSHNGEDYLAYTFYLKNAGKKARITENIRLEFSTKGVDAALRVRIYRNGTPVTYAKVGGDGLPETGTQPFTDGTVAAESFTLEAGECLRYTLVIWLEGDDPDCTDEIRGGSVRLSFRMSSEAEEES